MGRFLTDETGAVTVDWVVLTAGAVGLSLLALVAIRAGATDAAGETADNLDYAKIEETVSGTADPLGMALAMGFEHGAYDTDAEIAARLDFLMDPDALNDRKLRRQADRWQAKADDPSRTERQRQRARDEVKLYALALEARGL